MLAASVEDFAVGPCCVTLNSLRCSRHLCFLDSRRGLPGRQPAKCSNTCALSSPTDEAGVQSAHGKRISGRFVVKDEALRCATAVGGELMGHKGELGAGRARRRPSGRRQSLGRPIGAGRPASPRYDHERRQDASRSAKPSRRARPDSDRIDRCEALVSVGSIGSQHYKRRRTAPVSRRTVASECRGRLARRRHLALLGTAAHVEKACRSLRP
jgi:hypothetical protein